MIIYKEYEKYNIILAMKIASILWLIQLKSWTGVLAEWVIDFELKPEEKMI